MWLCHRLAVFDQFDSILLAWNSLTVPLMSCRLGFWRKFLRHLYPSVLSNFRPIYHLPFLSKVFEKVVFIQLQMILEINCIFGKFQSGFRSSYSSESALSHNDITLSVDSGNAAMLVLLDLTGTFDTVDHAVLVSLLEHYVGNDWKMLLFTEFSLLWGATRFDSRACFVCTLLISFGINYKKK